MCRQAARFRIYQDGSDDPITLNSENIASIEWTVHIANKKPSWYEFLTSQGEHGYAPTHPLRNPSVENRLELMIDAGPRSISGTEVSGPDYRFDANSAPSDYEGVHFPPGNLEPLGTPIDTLGELRTDADGSLLVLGGLGRSGTTDKSASLPNYANNNNWWDDTSDGPVKARITFNNGDDPIEIQAYVLVTPPSYVPQISNLVTLYDTILDASVKAGSYPDIQAGGFWKLGENGYQPDFETEIRPLLERASRYCWVSSVPRPAHEFDMEKLGDNSPENKDYRNNFLENLRAPNEENQLRAEKKEKGTKRIVKKMPYLAGDNALHPEYLISNYLCLTNTQYFLLMQWAEGYFTNDPNIPPGNLAPDPITRAVLENCVGGAFSPGIEMSWISRNAAIYGEPFRINGCFPDKKLSADFNPNCIEPGDITRYMAIPWQADFNLCTTQPITELNPPSGQNPEKRDMWWWPPQRPTKVYTEDDAEKLVPWTPLSFSGVSMVKYWSKLGFVIEKTIAGEQRFVEVERKLPRD